MRAQVLDNGNLKISAQDAERTQLAEDARTNEDFYSDAYMYDFFESLTCNSEYQFAYDGEIALCSAPVLCIRTNDEQGDILNAWGFMNYQIISVQQQILTHGYAIFQKG